MSIEDQMRQYAAGHQQPYDEPTWNQMCGNLMHRFNTWRGWIRPPYLALDPAAVAGDNSGPLNLNMDAAPAGAFHWIAVPGVPAGHVVQGAQSGGWRCLSTGYTAIGEILSPYALGFMNIRSYLDAKGATYRGWATNYAGGTIDLSSTAGGGSVPIITRRKGKQMQLAWSTDGTGWLVTEDGWHGLPSPQVYQLFYRLINSDQSKSPFVNGAVPDRFLKSEADIIAAQLKLLRVGNQVGAVVDPIKLASAIADALNAGGALDVQVTVENLQDAKFEVDPVALAAAFDAAVPRVSKAIVKAAGTAMAQAG